MVIPLNAVVAPGVEEASIALGATRAAHIIKAAGSWVAGPE